MNGLDIKPIAIFVVSSLYICGLFEEQKKIFFCKESLYEYIRDKTNRIRFVVVNNNASITGGWPHYLSKLNLCVILCIFSSLRRLSGSVCPCFG